MEGEKAKVKSLNRPATRVSKGVSRSSRKWMIQLTEEFAFGVVRRVYLLGGRLPEPRND